MSHDTQEDRRSSSVAVKPPTHTRAGHGDADAAEGAERSRQSRALRGDRLPSAELERAALGTGGKSSDRRLSPCGAAGSPHRPPPVLPVFTLRCDPVRLFCEGLLCAWLRRRVVPKPEPSLPPLTERVFCQGERGRRASDRSERDGVTGGWRHRR